MLDQEISEIIRDRTDDFSAYFTQTCADFSPEPLLNEGMSYALRGGKRIRPFMVLEIGALLGVSEKPLWDIACAVEIIHAYSLVHDDLPAMDDDDLRRGQPTVHKKFDEATAILIGDALQAEAFGLLASAETISAVHRVRLIAMLAKASGAKGMVTGQYADLQAEGRADITLEEMQKIQRLKTGALFEFCCCAPVVIADTSPEDYAILVRFSRVFGELFQLSDDIIGATVSAEISGKSTGSDARHAKATMVEKLGLASAQSRANCLSEQAIDTLKYIDIMHENHNFKNIYKLLMWLPSRQR